MARRANSENEYRFKINLKGAKRIGQQFDYLLEFGDSLWHEVKIEQVGSAVSGRRYPEIVEKHGRSPAQYAYAEA